MVKLKRSLGLFETTMYGVGIILGAGVYALIGKAAGVAGPAVWASFAVGAIIASLTGLSYAELGAMYPKDAAEYMYTKKAFGSRRLSFLIGWLIIFVGSIAAAAVSLGFGGYLYALTGAPVLVGALALIGALTFLNYWGMKESSKANVIFTLIELFGLLMIIALGFGHIQPAGYYTFSPGGFDGIFLGAILVFFAFLGFEDIVNIAEEVKNPRKNLPRALIISIGVTTLIYILVSVAAVSIVPWDVLAHSQAPLADVAKAAAIPNGFGLMAGIALFATANTVLILLVTMSRIAWGMAKERSLPRSCSKIDPVRRTPWVTVILIGGLAAAFTFIGNIKTVAEITDFGAFLIFFAVNIALIALRYKKPSEKRPFKVPFNIGRFPVLPALGAIFCAWMLTIFNLDVVLVGLGILASGLLVNFYLNCKIKNSLPDS